MSYASEMEELADYVRVQVAVGYYDVEALVDEVQYTFSTDEATVRPVVEAAWDAAVAEGDSWPDVTDCDRLDRAFAALDRSHIRARQHFACCNTCGHSEMADDIHFARVLRFERIDGYAFYHRQDADTAVTDGVLHVRYAGGDDEGSKAIAQRIVAALREAGLAPIWDGSAATTIQVPIRWQRRTWPDDDAKPPFDAEQTWCTRFGDAARSDYVGSLGESFLSALVATGRVELAYAYARAPVVSPIAPWPRASTLGFLARLTGDAAVWHEAFACVPYGPSGTIVELLLDVDLADPTLRTAVKRRVFDCRRDVHGAAAIAWYLARTEQRDEHLLDLVRRELDADDIFGDSAKLAIRAALLVLGDESHRATIVETLTGPAQYGIDAYARRAALRACPALCEPTPQLTLADAEARVVTLRAGVEDGLNTDGELETAEFELAILKRDLAGLATRYRDHAIAERAELRAHVEAVRDGAAPRVFQPDPRWLEPQRERTIERNLGKWTAATTRQARIRERRAGERVLEAAASIALRDRDRAVALIDAILVEDDVGVDMLDAHPVLVALLAIDELDRALAFADERFPGCAAAGALATHLASIGRTDEALALLEQSPPYLYVTSNLLALATSVLAVAHDRSACVLAMLAAWDQADAELAALIPPH